MGTTIRPEISKKNRYWIDKHTLNVITLQHYGVIPKLQFKKKNDIKA